MPYSPDRTDFFFLLSINGQYFGTKKNQAGFGEGGGKKKKKMNQVGGPGEGDGGWESQVWVEIGRRLPKRPHARIMHGAIGVPQSQPSC